MSGDAHLHRWRLVLGRYAERGLGCSALGAQDARADRALDHLYGRELDRRGIRSQTGERHGSLDPTQLTPLTWLGEIRELFPQSTFETVQRHAIERYEVRELLADPEVLAALEPNENLLASLMMLQGRADKAIETAIRQIARKVVEDIMRRLRSSVEAALSGRRNRFARSSFRTMRNFDWRGTIRDNLKNWDAERQLILAEKLRFHARERRRFPWTIILCLDQSGSMASSVIHAAVMAAIIAGLPSLRLHLVAFDTSVVDLSDRVADPVELLLSVQLGGGTNIGQAVTYCEQLVAQPSRTILVLVSDFCEGASPARLIEAVARLNEAKVRLLGLAALDERGVAAHDRAMAERLAATGMEIAAMTPEHFAAWLAEAIR